MVKIIQDPEKIEKIEKSKKKFKRSTHEDFLTPSFIIRSIIALLLYASVFFSQWALTYIWLPFLQTTYQVLNLDALFWNLSNYDETAHKIYTGMFIDNVLYLVLFITIVPLFMPEIKAGFRKLKNNMWKLSLIPVIQFTMLTITLIVNIIISNFMPLPDSSINQEMINQSMEVSVWGNIFPTIIAAPFVEEIIFRVVIGGGIFMLLTTLFNRKHSEGKKFLFSLIGIIVSVALFGYLHVTSGDYLAVFPYLVMGTMLAITYFVSDRNVVMSIGLHMYQNIFATIIQIIMR